MRLYLIASKVTDSVRHGFLPAARRLGLQVTVLTDRPAAYEGLASVVVCDVRDVYALIAALAELPAGEAIFSNSDHLQAQTAQAAGYFGLPGKDWRFAMRARNKALMRYHQAQAGAGRVRQDIMRPGGPLPAHLRYPVVVKPAEGVASEDVLLVHDEAGLVAHAAATWSRRTGAVLVAEEYLPGQLRTLETIGDGVSTWVLGGFRTRVSPPPRFIEERLDWATRQTPEPEMLTALAELGGGFGACHTEYVESDIIEVNDRAIGDHCDFLLQRVTGLPLFELVLRVHLGEQLPSHQPDPPADHGIADYVLATRPGVLTRAPQAGIATDGRVVVEYWPVAKLGDRIELTGTNRDYLGTILVTAPDPDAAERALAAFRDSESWVIA